MRGKLRGEQGRRGKGHLDKGTRGICTHSMGAKESESRGRKSRSESDESFTCSQAGNEALNEAQRVRPGAQGMTTIAPVMEPDKEHQDRTFLDALEPF